MKGKTIKPLKEIIEEYPLDIGRRKDFLNGTWNALTIKWTILIFKTSIHQKMPLRDNESNSQSKRRYSLHIHLIKHLSLEYIITPTNQKEKERQS